MNDNQKIHLEYGQKMLPGKQKFQYDEKRFGEWLTEHGLKIDPLTGKKVVGAVQAACLWAAWDPELLATYAKRYPRVSTVRGLHARHNVEQYGADTAPSVYVYRMRGPISNEILEPHICKIGHTDNGAAARIREQSKKAAVGYIPKIELEMKCDHPIRLEKFLHKKFKDRSVDALGKEWFRVSKEEVEGALLELERNDQLWRDGERIHMGRKPEKKPAKWSNEKKAAHPIYKKVLPEIITMHEESCLNMIMEKTGQNVTDAKIGLQWLIEKKYLYKSTGGMLTRSEKFNKHWNQEQSKKID